MEVLSKIQKDILRMFGRFPDSGQFYLTGGTALAHFYLRHRRSNDLDFFTATPEIVNTFGHHVQTALEGNGIHVKWSRAMNSFVELVVSRENESTIIQFAQDAAFHLEAKNEFPDYPGLKVDSLVDIAANKLLALFGRAMPRDFVDVYFLVQKTGFAPQDLIANAQKKDPGFDLYWLGVAFERIKIIGPSSPDILLLIEPLEFKELESFFEKWRQEIAAELKP